MRGAVLHQLYIVLSARLDKLCERNVPRDEKMIQSYYKVTSINFCFCAYVINFIIIFCNV